MKKTLLSLAIALSGYCSNAQNSNPWPASGDVTFGTDYTGQLIKAPQAGGAIQIKTNSATPDRGISLGLIGNDHVSYSPFLSIGDNGYVGIGTTSPQSKVHINDNGTSSNPINAYSGNLIIQGNSGGRSVTSGASMEFVIPANADGSNAWGQARIITVAGNTNTYDATGKMIFGTRRMFDKGVGTGTNWNYGDDLVIDGAGNIGINTLDPHGYKLAVNGSIHAQSVKVDMTGWNDAVFNKTYSLPTLSSVKSYINENHHLPEVPSEAEVIKNGVNVGDMLKLQTKKIEELTLYAIQQQEENEKLKAENKALKESQQKVDQAQEARIAALEKALSKSSNK